MRKTVLSLAPVPVDELKLLIQRWPGVPDTGVVDGYNISREQLVKAFANADLVLGDYSFKHRIGSELVAMALALLRKLVRADRGVRAGRWERMTLRPAELGGKTWGVVGLGQIGRAVALRLRSFGLAKVLYYEPRQAPEEVEEQCGVEYSALSTLLKSSDIVSLHMPLTESTRNMIGTEALSSMKAEAHLINVSRGGLVDAAALADALRRGVISGAAIDVFAEEPPSAMDPLLQVPEEKTLLSPHIAGISPESIRRLLVQSTENIGRVLAGQAPLYVVNP